MTPHPPHDLPEWWPYLTAALLLAGLVATVRLMLDEGRDKQ